MTRILEQPLPLRGVIQHYDWGGYDYLPKLIRQDNTEREPWAELWLGAHPKGPAHVRAAGAKLDLRQLICENPRQLLGTQVDGEYEHELPFLLKVLDVREMLSIQAHPNREAARAGYEREENAGISPNASHRNYRDRNHKPELGVALTDFYLLHGFRDEAAIRRTLDEIPSWEPLRAVLSEGGVRGLYQHVMELPQEQVNSLLEPLYRQLESDAMAELLHRAQPGFWAHRAFRQYTRDGDYDRGIFSIYWFNLVHLEPEEGIFNAAGVPHAYLEGVNVEIMANSDNVLRGGLTPKHIAVKELLDNLVFDAITPRILRPREEPDGWRHYDTPAPDFHLARRGLTYDQYFREQAGPAIYLVLRGEITLNAEGRYKTGDSFFLPHGVKIDIRCESAEAEVFRATVG